MENFKIDDKEDIKLIANFVKEKDIKVIFFDSFRRFFVGKENEADVISHLFDYLKALRIACGGITIICIHHAKKGGNDPSEDIRDILRGSSDIVNSADSIIAVKRKIGQNALIIEHIKNRSGEEMRGKLIKLESADGKTYIYESGDVEEIKNKPSKPEECANKLLTFLEDNNLLNFSRRDIKSLEESYSYDLITKALRMLKQDGTLIENNAGKYTNYTFVALANNFDCAKKDEKNDKL